jgi:hypothetical protein
VPDLVLARADTALEVLRQRPEVDTARLGETGFCFGGSTVLHLARSGADLKAVVGFRGALSTRARAKAGSVTAGILPCTGAESPSLSRGLVPSQANCMRPVERASLDAVWLWSVSAVRQHLVLERVVCVSPDRAACANPCHH